MKNFEELIVVNNLVIEVYEKIADDRIVLKTDYMINEDVTSGSIISGMIISWSNHNNVNFSASFKIKNHNINLFLIGLMRPGVYISFEHLNKHYTKRYIFCDPKSIDEIIIDSKSIIDLKLNKASISFTGFESADWITCKTDGVGLIPTASV